MDRSLIMIHALRLHDGTSRHPGGNYSHVRHLLQALMPEVDAAGMRMVALVDDCGARELSDVVPTSSLLRIGAARDNIIRSGRAVVNAISSVQPDLYYRPTGQLPFARLACPAVMGIADLNFRWLKTGLKKRIYKEITYWWSVRRAARVICVSCFTRDDVLSKYNVPLAKLRVIHHGTSVLPAPRGFEIDGAYIWLTFGHQSHKNVELCLHAIQRGTSIKAEEVLVVVGQNAHIETVLKPLAMSLGVSDRVRFVGRISDEQLSFLYQKATALLFVSKFEGFGLPVLEAMQLGCPVVVSNVCSLPEIVGDAGMLVSPNDVSQLRCVMDLLISDRGVAERMSAKGRHRARQFDWNRAARQTLEVFNEVLETDRTNRML